MSWKCGTTAINYLFLSSVHPREPCTVHQVLSGPGDSVSLPDSCTADQHDPGHAIVATGHCQVWEEDGVLCWHVDSVAPAPVPALC